MICPPEALRAGAQLTSLSRRSPEIHGRRWPKCSIGKCSPKEHMFSACQDNFCQFSVESGTAAGVATWYRYGYRGRKMRVDHRWPEISGHHLRIRMEWWSASLGFSERAN